MKLKNNYLQFRDSMKAWEGLNELFLFNLPGMDIQRISKAQYLNDITVFIENPLVDPLFDFGRHFNYTHAKWKSLVGNYLNLDKLWLWKQVVEEVKDKKLFNIACQFDNHHAHGKNCLLSFTVSRKAGIEKPVITAFMRASEVTKRLICDFLLLQRIGEYFLGEGNFHLCIHFNQIFNDDTVLLMYHAHKDLFKLEKKHGVIDYNWHDRLEYLLKCDPSDIKYKVHKRALKVLRPEIFKYPKTLAKDCKLPLD